MIEPFFFGSEPLFGVYHPAQDVDADKLVVICAPLFDEYRRSYRAMADFAAACSEKGYHVLRFDYLGTGDSYGELAEVDTINEWLTNIDDAIEEGCALSGADQVTLVGVRFGAALAAGAQHPAVMQRILWDPIANGLDYTRWLDAVDQWQRDDHTKMAKIIGDRGPDRDESQFLLNPALRASIEAWTFPTDLLKVHLVFSQQNSDAQFENYNGISVDNGYDWPPYDEGLIRPVNAFTQMLKHL